MRKKIIFTQTQSLSIINEAIAFNPQAHYANHAALLIMKKHPNLFKSKSKTVLMLNH